MHSSHWCLTALFQLIILLKILIGSPLPPYQFLPCSIRLSVIGYLSLASLLITPYPLHLHTVLQHIELHSVPGMYLEFNNILHKHFLLHGPHSHPPIPLLCLKCHLYYLNLSLERTSSRRLTFPQAPNPSYVLYHHSNLYLSLHLFIFIFKWAVHPMCSTNSQSEIKSCMLYHVSLPGTPLLLSSEPLIKPWVTSLSEILMDCDLCKGLYFKLSWPWLSSNLFCTTNQENLPAYMNASLTLCTFLIPSLQS